MKDDAISQRSLRWSVVGELSSRVSHESNNLLAGILGQAELGLLSQDSARMATSLESIVRSSRDLKSLTERLLGFARMVEPGQRSVNLLEMFRMMYGLMEGAFTKTGVQVEQRFGAVPTTWCDPGSVAPSLLFCLTSALDMCRKAGGGKMLIEVLPETGRILFSLKLSSANGKPLEAAKGRSGDLSFDQAAEIAHEEGGDLRIAFEGDTWTFLCRFPHRAEAPAAQGQDAAVVRAKRPARKLSALVVEDEPSVRELVREVLQGCGCRVETEADAATALALFQQVRHDVVLTDISMPGMDGLTLIRKLRAADPLAVVVVITGRVTAASVREALEAGAKMVLPKPFDLSELRAIVDHLRQDPSGESLRRLSRTEPLVTGPR